MADVTDRYDVIVAGGGMAGVSAAVAAARQGARTLLIERNHCLGGAATMRTVLTWCGLYTLDDSRRQVVFGIADEVLAGQEARGGLGPIMAFRGVFRPFDPETLKVVLDDIVGAAGLDLRFGATVLGATRVDNTLRDVSIVSHGGIETFAAAAFVDCTGDGDLAAFGGADTRYGNPDGVNLGTLGCRFGGIPGDVTVTVDHVSAAVAAHADRDGVTKDRCVVVRLPRSHDLVLYLASHDYDPRDGSALARAEMNVRQQAWRYLTALQNIPGCENAYLVATGPEIGTRESRHLNCHKQLTWDHIATRASHDDSIALGAWGSEWHDRDSYKSTFDYPPDKAAYEIPFGCLHSRDTPNLFCAGRLADGDRKGGAAIRVMGTSMATGQAAGTAAALTADGRFSVDQTRQTLRSAGAVLRTSDM